MYLVKSFGDSTISKQAAITSLQAAFKDLLHKHCHTNYQKLQEAIAHPCEDPSPATWLSRSRSSSNATSTLQFSPAASRNLQPLTPGLLQQTAKALVQTWDEGQQQQQRQQPQWKRQQQQGQQMASRKRMVPEPFETAHDATDDYELLQGVEGDEGSQVPVLSQYRPDGVAGGGAAFGF